MSAAPAQSPQPLPLFTLVIWVVCAAVGGLGLVLHYPWPQAQKTEPTPVLAQLAEVALPKAEPKPETPEELPPPTAQPVTDNTPAPETRAAPRAPTAPPPLAAPDAPAFTPVAAPSAAIAFAVPVAGPTRVVAATKAAPTRVTGSTHGTPGGTGTTPPAHPSAAPAGPQAQTLVMGQGEGNQQAPDYPREALRRRQEGSVLVQLEVNEQGEVTAAEVAKPCDHPLLNQAALRTVKRSWHFPAGPKRLYQVSIKFVLQ